MVKWQILQKYLTNFQSNYLWNWLWYRQNYFFCTKGDQYGRVGYEKDPIRSDNVKKGGQSQGSSLPPTSMGVHPPSETQVCVNMTSPLKTFMGGFCGQTQLISCFSNPPVYLLLNKLRKIWEIVIFFYFFYFFFTNLLNILHFHTIFWLFFLFITLSPLKWDWERSQKQRIN